MLPRSVPSRLSRWFSALWVGQAGSLLLWSWFVVVLAVMLRWWRGRGVEPLRIPAAGVLLGYVCFLTVLMVFAADPMAPSITAPREGMGLSPLLQHPAMLIHPPIVFLGYSLWTVPFAVTVAALLTNRLDLNWLHFARPWALLAWAVLGVGILLGAQWAYEELGWGGYWAWDPVENGSLLPWLTGTAFIHGLMAWQHRQILKKTAIVLAIVTFGLCNFATFLTRSGVFSSLHAFSQSPIGWLFLVMMFAVALVAFVLLGRRWEALKPERTICSLLSREACLVAGSLALLLLTVVVLCGTLSSALSSLVAGKTILVGPPFYNNVLIPTGLLMLSTMSVAPVLNWGSAPSGRQKRWFWRQ
jgi:cytochrome c-type biogenesis protein CcmF